MTCPHSGVKGSGVCPHALSYRPGAYEKKAVGFIYEGAIKVFSSQADPSAKQQGVLLAKEGFRLLKHSPITYIVLVAMLWGILRR